MWFCLGLTVMGLCLRVPVGMLLNGTILDVTRIPGVNRWIYVSVGLHLVAFYVLICLPNRWAPGFPTDVSVTCLSLTYLFAAGASFGFFAAVSHLSELSIAATDKVSGGPQNNGNDLKGLYC